MVEKFLWLCHPFSGTFIHVTPHLSSHVSVIRKRRVRVVLMKLIIYPVLTSRFAWKENFLSPWPTPQFGPQRWLLFRPPEPDGMHLPRICYFSTLSFHIKASFLSIYFERFQVDKSVGVAPPSFVTASFYDFYSLYITPSVLFFPRSSWSLSKCILHTSSQSSQFSHLPSKSNATVPGAVLYLSVPQLHTSFMQSQPSFPAQHPPSKMESSSYGQECLTGLATWSRRPLNHGHRGAVLLQDNSVFVLHYLEVSDSLTELPVRLRLAMMWGLSIVGVRMDSLGFSMYLHPRRIRVYTDTCAEMSRTR